MNNHEVKKYYYKNGSVLIEHHLNGKRHREDGPACIGYYKNGSVSYESYYINGIYLTKEEWYNMLTTKQKVNLLYGKGNE